MFLGLLPLERCTIFIYGEARTAAGFTGCALHSKESDKRLFIKRGKNVKRGVVFSAVVVTRMNINDCKSFRRCSYKPNESARLLYLKLAAALAKYMWEHTR